MLLPFGAPDINTTKDRASEDIDRAQTTCLPPQVRKEADVATGY